MVKDNPDLKENTVEELTSSLWSMQEANSANKERSRHSSREDQLARAKASRSQAETIRQKIANEILEATKGACQKLITDAEQTLQRVKILEAEGQQETQVELEKAKATRAEAEAYAEKLKSEAQEQLDQAQNIRDQADAYRGNVITAAKEQGQEILYLARSSVEQECNEMKHQASLEAQRIIAEAARLETESLEVLAQVRAKSGEQIVLPQWKDAGFQSKEPNDESPLVEVGQDPNPGGAAGVRPVKIPRSRKNKV